MRHCRLWLEALILFGVVFAIPSQGLGLTVARSDILLHIVSQCVDTSKEGYCSNCMLPRADARCSEVLECKKTNEVWALDGKYVAIRDIKMCGCPAGFTHGLAMPRNVVTGVEDVSREEGIWEFAWHEGLKRIEPESLALVVNPKSERTQNQLHIHMVRLNQNARANFAEYPHESVPNLEQVWSVAERIAVSQGFGDYGVLVTRESGNGYVVLVSKKSPEAAFTVWNCGN